MPDNPPAFPIPEQVFSDGEMQVTRQGSYGMTLRDYFAGQALAGVIHQSAVAPEVAQTIMNVAAANGVTEHDVIARAAYHYADAMLRVREKGGD